MSDSLSHLLYYMAVLFHATCEVARCISIAICKTTKRGSRGPSQGQMVKVTVRIVFTIYLHFITRKEVLAFH